MAAATRGSSPEEILDQLGEHCLSCSICLEQYKVPKLLPCHHTYCLHCLEALVKKKGVLLCPSCQLEVDIPKGGVAALKNNFFMNTILDVVENRTGEAKETQQKCEWCEDSIATTHCRDCEQYFCDGCLNTAHKKMKRANTHKVVSAEGHGATVFAMKVAISSLEQCNAHPDNKVRFFCDTCHVPICSDCTVIEHPNTSHSYRYLQTVKNECAEKLSDMVKRMKVKAREAAGSKVTTIAVRNTVKDQYGVVAHTITKQEETRTEILKTSVKEERSALVEKLKTECHQQVKQLDTQIADLEFKYDNIITTSRYVESLITQGSAAQLVSSTDTLVQRMEELVAMETKPAIRQEVVTFKPYSDVTTEGMLGVLRFDACPSMCAVENVPKKLVNGESVKLLITTKNARGKTIIPNQEVKVRIRKPDGSQEDMPVTDNKDGTHTVVISGEMEGKYQVTMMIGNDPLPGSPLNIPVIKGLVKTIGKHGNGEGQFRAPNSVTFNRHGDMVVADSSNRRLQLIDIRGKWKKNVYFSQLNNFHPVAVAISADDEYFTTGWGDKEVVVCNEDGHIKRCFGRNQLKYPLYVSISPLDGTVYVTDWDVKVGDKTDKEDSHCIRKYRQNGDYITSIGRYGDNNGKFIGPSYMHIDDQGIIYVTDSRHVSVFNADDQFLYKFRGIGHSKGLLYNPSGIVMDKDRYLYVSDEKDRVLKFDVSGRFICRVDRDEDGLKNPVGLALTEDVPVKLVVVDNQNHCLKVFVL